jgi:hypothetical protein
MFTTAYHKAYPGPVESSLQLKIHFNTISQVKPRSSKQSLGFGFDDQTFVNLSDVSH